MSTVTALSDAEKHFLHPFLPPSPSPNNEASPAVGADRPPAKSAGDSGAQRPFVTLTYASSLDGMISLAPGTRTTLSGPETKSMTHYLRSHHDAILVGVGTAVADDPSLNCRYPGAGFEDQPRPVIIDPIRRWDIERAKVYSLASEAQGKTPVVLHTQADTGGKVLDFCEHISIQPDPERSDNRIPWATILRHLKAHGIKSIMIEGGATVISSLMSTPDLVDSVIVTIAPTWLGEGGVAVTPSPVTVQRTRVNAAWLRDAAWRQFGHDAVLCGYLQAVDHDGS